MKNILHNIKRARVLLLVFLFTPFMDADEGISAEAQAVFDSYVEAIGGREVIENVETLKIVGTMNIPSMNMSANVLMIQKAPNLFYSEQNIPGMGKMVQAYDGKVGWANDSMQGFRPLVGEELELLLEENSVHSDLLLAERYASAEVIENPTAEGLIVVKATRKINGNVDTLNFDSKTRFLTSLEAVEDMGPQGSIPVKVLLLDYQEFDGIKSPRKLVMENPAMTIEMNFEDFEVNGEVAEGQFSSP